MHTAAGLADLAADGLRGLGRRLAPSTVGDATADLRSRGELAVKRQSHVPQPHLETLAQLAVAARDAKLDA
jgi:hypothetical protein